MVEHLFNHHEYCDEKWCQPKLNARLKRKEEGSQSHYRCKEKDKELYTQIWKAYRPFTTPTRLKESLHDFDTQKNEAMNASIAKYAPKTKTYGMTISLTNRVMIARGINNKGQRNIGTMYTKNLISRWHPKLSPFFSLKIKLGSIKRNTKNRRQ